MLSDTEADLPRLEGEMRAKYAEAYQLEERVRALREKASQRLQNKLSKILDRADDRRARVMAGGDA